MPKPFGSAEWVAALKDQINASQAYADSAATWEGDFYFIVEAGAAAPAPIYMYMDLWHGKCRDAFVAPDQSAKNPAFIISAPYPNWKKVVTAQIDPIQALLTNQLKLKGNLVKIMKYVLAAQELVKACTRVDTEFVM
ncbi:MAG: SCP2 sterol-binding domain-containing protein [Chloroflexi bacterium]|nr:SCP2 sterol-binding domain-containing protein [Chloroflexota bacterium]